MFPPSENMNKMYGFEGEVKAKYSANMCELFTEVYNWLPLCHLLNHKVERSVETEPPKKRKQLHFWTF